MINYLTFIDLPEHHPTISSYHPHEFMAVFIVNGHLKVADGRFDRSRQNQDRLRLVLGQAYDVSFISLKAVDSCFFFQSEVD